MTLRSLLAQGSAWALLLAPVILLASWPSYRPLPAAHGELRLSLAHLSQRLQACRPLSAAELGKLPANMRAAESCPRGRFPVVLRVTLNGRELLSTTVAAAGLHGDGRAYLFQRWPLPAGNHELQVHWRDGPGPMRATPAMPLSISAGSSRLLEIGDRGIVLRARAQQPDSAKDSTDE